MQKAMCGTSLMKKLSPDTAQDLVIMADLYRVDNLRKVAIEYIVENRKHLMAQVWAKILLF